MGEKAAYRRLLLRACEMLGGADVLAARLDKPVGEMHEYLVGAKPISVPMFTKALDILLEGPPVPHLIPAVQEVQPESETQKAAGSATKRSAKAERARESLRESEDKFRTVFENMIEACCIFDMIFDDDGKPVDWRILEANPGYERQSGLQDVAGKLASEVMPGTEPYWIEAFGRVVDTGVAEQIERWHQPTGRWIHSSTARLGGPGSRRLVSVFYDITERKNAETTLRESEALLRKSDQAL